jgi:hypothetical protein
VREKDNLPDDIHSKLGMVQIFESAEFAEEVKGRA